MGGPRGIKDVIQQQQPSPLFVLLGINNHVPTLTVISGSRVLGDYIHRPAKLLRSTGDVHRMEPLMIVTTHVLTHSNYKDCAVRARRKINDWSRSNSDLRSNLRATPIIRDRKST